jgi:hypothetical protein
MKMFEKIRMSRTMGVESGLVPGKEHQGLDSPSRVSAGVCHHSNDIYRALPVPRLHTGHVASPRGDPGGQSCDISFSSHGH